MIVPVVLIESVPSQSLPRLASSQQQSKMGLSLLSLAENGIFPSFTVGVTPNFARI